MKYILTLILITVCLAAFSTDASNLNMDSNLIDEGIEPAATVFPTILDNIPLMQGLQKATDKDLLNILPSSNNTTSVVAVGVVDIDDLYDFYKRILPPMGWVLSGSRDYTKGQEALHIDAHADGKRSTVIFSEQTN